jgi:hypothetical protein
LQTQKCFDLEWFVDIRLLEMEKTVLLLLALLLTYGSAQGAPENELNGPGNLVISGTGNVANGEYNVFDGSSNTAQGNENDFKGNLNTASGNENHIQGVLHEVSGEKNDVSGVVNGVNGT